MIINESFWDDSTEDIETQQEDIVSDETRLSEYSHFLRLRFTFSFITKAAEIRKLIQVVDNFLDSLNCADFSESEVHLHKSDVNPRTLTDAEYKAHKDDRSKENCMSMVFGFHPRFSSSIQIYKIYQKLFQIPYNVNPKTMCLESIQYSADESLESNKDIYIYRDDLTVRKGNMNDKKKQMDLLYHVCMQFLPDDDYNYNMIRPFFSKPIEEWCIGSAKQSNKGYKFQRFKFTNHNIKVSDVPDLFWKKLPMVSVLTDNEFTWNMSDEFGSTVDAMKRNIGKFLKTNYPDAELVPIFGLLSRGTNVYISLQFCIKDTIMKDDKHVYVRFFNHGGTRTWFKDSVGKLLSQLSLLGYDKDDIVNAFDKSESGKMYTRDSKEEIKQYMEKYEG